MYLLAIGEVTVWVDNVTHFSGNIHLNNFEAVDLPLHFTVLTLHLRPSDVSLAAAVGVSAALTNRDRIENTWRCTSDEPSDDCAYMYCCVLCHTITGLTGQPLPVAVWKMDGFNDSHWSDVSELSAPAPSVWPSQLDDVSAFWVNGSVTSDGLFCRLHMKTSALVWPSVCTCL